MKTRKSIRFDSFYDIYIALAHPFLLILIAGPSRAKSGYNFFVVVNVETKELN